MRRGTRIGDRAMARRAMSKTRKPKRARVILTCDAGSAVKAMRQISG